MRKHVRWNRAELNRRIAVVLIFAAIAGGLASRFLVPTALEIRLAKVGWQSVEVGSEDLEQPQIFHPGDEIVVSPISHGVYRIRVTMDDGRQMWLEYLHSDAGARRRVYLDVMPGSGDTFQVKQYARPWPFLRVDDLFDGTVRPDSTSQTSPARLGWI